jgi:hypothetical protein
VRLAGAGCRGAGGPPLAAPTQPPPARTPVHPRNRRSRSGAAARDGGAPGAHPGPRRGGAPLGGAPLGERQGGRQGGGGHWATPKRMGRETTSEQDPASVPCPDSQARALVHAAFGLLRPGGQGRTSRGTRGAAALPKTPGSSCDRLSLRPWCCPDTRRSLERLTPGMTWHWAPGVPSRAGGKREVSSSPLHPCMLARAVLERT